MKKILLAFGGTQFSEGMFHFARRMNELHPILVVGVFLPDVIYADIYNFGTGLPGNEVIPMISEDDNEIIQQNMDRLQDLCRRNGISCRVHKDYDGPPLLELKNETRFADLLIIGSERFYDSLGFNNANPSMKEALHAAECPVIIVPEQFHFPQSNIMAYDGSAASVYAIKQFAYLFPELCGNDTLLVYVSEKGGAQLPDEKDIEELASQHFRNLDLLKLQVNAKKYLTSWLIENKYPLLIGGSFGRSAISQLFRRSFVAEVISEHRIPVFIAHT